MTETIPTYNAIDYKSQKYASEIFFLGFLFSSEVFVMTSNPSNVTMVKTNFVNS